MRALIVTIILLAGFYLIGNLGVSQEEVAARIAKDAAIFSHRKERIFNIENILAKLNYPKQYAVLYDAQIARSAERAKEYSDNDCYDDVIRPFIMLETKRYFSYDSMKQLWLKALASDIPMNEIHFLNGKAHLITTDRAHYDKVMAAYKAYKLLEADYIRGFPQALEARMEDVIDPSGCL